jgi:putative inorganic carbon (HCO3(-)) transporter
MRDVVVLVIILGSTPFCLFNPYFGILMWTWIAYFNPHRFTFGAAYNFPVALVIAIPTIAGTIFERKRNHKIFTVEFFLLLMLWAWFAVTTVCALQNPMFADHSADSRVALIGVSKILLMTVMSILLISSEKRLRTLLIVTSLSFGALAVKGALFGANTSGEFRVFGPPGTFVADNNDLALAMDMTLPMMFFLARSETRPIWRRLLWISFFCGIFCVLLSYSRGGLLGLTTALGMIILRTKRKTLASLLVVLLAFLVLTFAPQAWMDRMSNFFHGNLDESAQLRLNAWQFAFTLASEYPVTGGGFETFTPELYNRFTPNLRFAGPHSIYFQLLGEQGFVGLGLFLLLIARMWFCTRRLRLRAGGQPGLTWVADYTYIIQGGLAAYMVSGAFLPRAYFDLFYLFVASTVILGVLYKQEVFLKAQADESALTATAFGETAYP